MSENKLTIGNIEKEGRFLIKLIRSALSEDYVPEYSAQIHWKFVYDIAKENDVLGISYMGVLKYCDCYSSHAEANHFNQITELLKKWEDKYYTTIYRKLRFDREREQIYSEMEQQGLSYLPLKGILLCEYYPNPGMRSMADNDLLYGLVEKSSTDKYVSINVKKAQKIMTDIMSARDYQIYSLESIHDAYVKKPIFNFEMHRQLVKASSPFYEYYKNPWSRAVRVSMDRNEYRFSHEDEYIYVMVHGYGHLKNSGCGIKSIIDQYVFIKNMGETLDWGYIGCELEKINLKNFEENLRKTGEKLFKTGSDLNKQQEKLLIYMLKSGTYGNLEQAAGNKISSLSKLYGSETKGKMSYIKARLLPPDDSWDGYKQRYNNLFFNILRIPVRIVKGLIIHPEKIVLEIRLLFHGGRH